MQQHHKKSNIGVIYSLRLPLISLGTFLIVFLVGSTLVYASATSGTINSTHKYAWGNVAGYINFAPSHSVVTVTDSVISGYAWSANDGWINLSPTYGGVRNNGNGILSGFAWDERAGWINFSGVTINSAGVFHGVATGVTISGANYAINFDCTSCNVQTDWRPVSLRVQNIANATPTPGAIGVTFTKTAQPISSSSDNSFDNKKVTTNKTMTSQTTEPSSHTTSGKSIPSGKKVGYEPVQSKQRKVRSSNITNGQSRIPPPIANGAQSFLGINIHNTLLSISIASAILFVLLLFVFFL